MIEGRGFASGATGDKKINAGFHLPCDQISQSGFVNGTVLTKRSYQRCTASPEILCMLLRYREARRVEMGQGLRGFVAG